MLYPSGSCVTIGVRTKLNWATNYAVPMLPIATTVHRSSPYKHSNEVRAELGLALDRERHLQRGSNPD
eukprot:1196149-Prorocentrum_minimum.AAC.7